MAEVFGAVGAGVGVVAATGQLIDGIMKLHSFCSQIRDIPDDIQTAVDDLSTMVEVLEFVQVEMGHEIFPSQPSHLPSSIKVLSNLQQSSKQVGEVLEDMRIILGKKKYWGRIKAAGTTKKLEKAAQRVENAQRMVLILLAAENRMTVRQCFNAQRKELTAISTRCFSLSSPGQFTGEISGDNHAIHDIESSDTSDENPHTAGPAPRQPIRRTSKAKSCRTASMYLRLPNLFLNTVWEFSVHKANQGWDFSLRSYNIRPRNAQIFQAIRNGDVSQVRELLHSGRASICDRDPSGNGVLHYAALSCHDHGSTVLEYLVKRGADIYAMDFEGYLPYMLLPSSRSDLVDEQMVQRLIAGYKVFMSHRDWIPPRPTMRVPCENFKITGDIIDMFPIFRNPPEEVIRSVLHEMWPPWKDTPPADRIKTLFPKYDLPTLTELATSPLSIRECLSRQDIQETFANWDTGDKIELIRYAIGALAEQLAFGLEKEIEEARLFLRDMYLTHSLINMLAEIDPLPLFVKSYARTASRSQRRPWGAEKFVHSAQEGLKYYISELMLLGIDMATVIGIERQSLARQKEESVEIGIYGLSGWYRIIAIDYGPKVDDWYLWLSNPLDEWAGEFWDMIEHPERAIPGAWQEV